MHVLRWALIAVALTGLLVSSPVQGALLGDFTIQDEVELGREVNQFVRSHFDLLNDPVVAEYVRSVTERIESHLPPQPFPISVTVVNDESLNAFAAPAGYMFVHTGLLLHLESEAQLAGVIAHELAHVTQRHIARNIERSQLINLGTLAGMLAGVFLGGGGEGSEALAMGSLAGGQAAALKYSREDEREADQIGVHYLQNAGYPVQGMVEAFEVIRKRKWFSGHSLPTYLSTHPGVGERIAALQGRVEGESSGSSSLQSGTSRFERIQMLVRARYTDPSSALVAFNDTQSEQDTCMLALGRAIALERLQRVEEAGQAYERALDCAPDDPLVQREAGHFMYLQGKLDRARRLLKAALDQRHTDTRAMFWYAQTLAQAGDPEHSIRIGEEVVRREPRNARAHAFLGRLQGQRGKLFEAHLHLAYAALYGHGASQLPFHIQKTKEMAHSEKQRQRLSSLQEAVAESKKLEKLTP